MYLHGDRKERENPLAGASFAEQVKAANLRIGNSEKYNLQSELVDGKGLDAQNAKVRRFTAVALGLQELWPVVRERIDRSEDHLGLDISETEIRRAKSVGNLKDLCTSAITSLWKPEIVRICGPLGGSQKVKDVAEQFPDEPRWLQVLHEESGVAGPIGKFLEGLNTANLIMWNTYAVIAPVLARDLHSEPSRELLIETAKHTSSSFSVWASTDLHYLRSLLGTVCDDRVLAFDPSFDPKFFSTRERSAGGFQIVPVGLESYFQQMKAAEENKQPHLGCPILAAKVAASSPGSSATNEKARLHSVMAEYTAWNLRIAERYFFPYVPLSRGSR